MQLRRVCHDTLPWLISISLDCLGHERGDIITLTYLCVLFGWDAYFLPTAGYTRAFVSHDEFVRLEFSYKALFEKTTASLQAGKVEMLPDSV